MTTTPETADGPAVDRSRVTVEPDPLAESGAGSAAQELELAAGAKLDRFEILGVLGRGGSGVVYSALDPTRDEPVALKLIREPGKAEHHAALVREAEALAAIAHPNVVTVHEIGATADGATFLSMELVRGQTLEAWLRAEARSLAELRRVFELAGRGLIAAHQAGLVHGDFKPANVMLAQDRVVLLDFGLAHDPGTRAATRGGTRAYMAPELLWQLAPASPRSDQFSLCVALWEAVYDERPFERRDIHAGPASPPANARSRRVPAALRRALVRGLALDPDARCESLEPILSALARRWSWSR